MELHLAPLENVSCFAFRSLCKGQTDSYTGMLSLSNLVKRNNVWKEVDIFKIENQRQWIQVATSKETECAAFLLKLEEELKAFPEKDNVYGIQLNASCPSPSLIRIGQGPALIKRATKVSNLLKELLKGRFKVSLKVRLGLNDFEVKQKKILSLFQELEKIEHPNFAGVTVHFKHAQQKSADNYDYSMIKELCRFNVPMVVNGGINSYADFLKIIEGVDSKNIKGFMIGRAAMENPNAIEKMRCEMNGSSFVERSSAVLKKEFEALCKAHPPNQSYIDKIHKYCAWSRGSEPAGPYTPKGFYG
jgi:tRNA-dihydrouridine synthase